MQDPVCGTALCHEEDDALARSIFARMGISFLLHRSARICIETRILSQVQMHSWYVTEINALIVSGSGNKKG